MDQDQDVFTRQIELLTRAYPGRLTLTLDEACAAVNLRKKTFFDRVSRGDLPLPARRQGGKLVVLIEDVARAALGLPAVKVTPRPTQMPARPVQRRGRHRHEEKDEAARQGITVSELRAQRAGGETD